MVLQVTTSNNVKVYTVSGGTGSRAIPDWLAKKKKKALKSDFDYRTRVELIQDFEFPEASYSIKTTRDGNYAVAVGTYKPRVRVYEFANMSMKFERHIDAEAINFEILSDDWTKLAILQNDRSVEIHAQGGLHYRTRVPAFGRDLAYQLPTCDLLISASKNEVYRLNLEQGRFLTPLQTDATSGVNCVEINPAHQLFGFGADNGTVELWDPRSRARVGLLSDLKIPASYGSDTVSTSVTALSFRNDGLTMGVGTSSGHTLLYDLRMSMPSLVKDHQYGFPIKSIRFHNGGSRSGDIEGASDKVVVSDCKIVKIWDRTNGKPFTSIEPENDINDVCLVEDSGLLFTAQEGIQMGAYFIPQLGPAPRWASYLENVTEEMEENPNRDVYDDYKFVTRKELTALGLEHLMGTNVLRAYMHGFFVDFRLYEKAKLIANPFAYEEYKKRAVRDKIEKERGSRIRSNNKLPAVNKDLAKKIQGESKKKKNENALTDNRFKDMFEDPDFEVDQGSKEFRLLHPMQNTKTNRVALDTQEDDDEEVDDDAQANDAMDEDGSSDSDQLQGESDSDDDIISKIRKERGLTVRDKKKTMTSIRSGARLPKQNKKKTVMRVGTEGGRMVSKNEAHQSFGKRLQSGAASRKNEGHRVSRTTLGGMEMSFTPKSPGSKRKQQKK